MEFYVLNSYASEEDKELANIYYSEILKKTKMASNQLCHLEKESLQSQHPKFSKFLIPHTQTKYELVNLLHPCGVSFGHYDIEVNANNFFEAFCYVNDFIINNPVDGFGGWDLINYGMDRLTLSRWKVLSIDTEFDLLEKMVSQYQTPTFSSCGGYFNFKIKKH